MYIQERFDFPNNTPESFYRIEEVTQRHHAEMELHSHSPLSFSIYVKPEVLETIAKDLEDIGAIRLEHTQLQIKACPKEGVVPDDFYSTSNHPTFVYLQNRWVPVEKLRMDGVILIEEGRAVCTIMRNVKQGQEIVVTHNGVRIALPGIPSEKDREFAFMTSEVSSERQVPVLIRKVAHDMKAIRDRGGKIVFVGGPGIVHTGGMNAFCELIQKGFVQAVLSGNALAVHDIENSFFHTSLGVSTATANPVAGGHMHHLRAINRIRFHGSIRAAVESGTLKSGIMYNLIQHNVPYCLAGSIRDDGPLPDTQMDLIQAQTEYAEMVEGSDMVIMIASMLHAIGTGNMIPSTTRTICVDINPAVVAKLADRGSTQTVGIVTDAGLFVEMLNREL